MREQFVQIFRPRMGGDPEVSEVESESSPTTVSWNGPDTPFKPGPLDVLATRYRPSIQAYWGAPWAPRPVEPRSGTRSRPRPGCPYPG